MDETAPGASSPTGDVGLPAAKVGVVPEPGGQNGVTMSDRALTPQQRKFVEAYAACPNATEAARRAGYSAKNANVIGPRLVGKSHVREAIREALEVKEARAELTAEKTVRELMIIAFSDISDYDVDERGRLVIRPGAQRGARRAVKYFARKERTRTKRTPAGRVTETEVTVTIVLWDKIMALKALWRHLGLNVPKPLDPIDAIMPHLPSGLAARLREYLREAAAKNSSTAADQTGKPADAGGHR
jgi:phage terminase small subunit